MVTDLTKLGDAVEAGFRKVSDMRDLSNLVAQTITAIRRLAVQQDDVRELVVPPLQWTDSESPNAYCHYDHCFADTPFGRFQIEWKSWKTYPGFTVEGPNDFFSSFNTLEEAKQGAQKHLEAAIQQLLRRPEQTGDTK